MQLRWKIVGQFFKHCKYSYCMIQQVHFWVNTREKRKHMFMQTLIHTFLVANKWERPTFPSANIWIHKLWSIHTRACYSAVNGSGTLTPTTTCVNFENMRKQPDTQGHILSDSVNVKCRTGKPAGTDQRSPGAGGRERGPSS